METVEWLMRPRHPKQEFGRDGDEAMHMEIPMASRGHGHLFEWIEGRAQLEVAH